MSTGQPSRDVRRHTRPDAELLAAVARGELHALGVLFDRYHRDLYRFLGRYTIGHAEDVDDLVQLTFLELPKIAHAFVGDGSCRAWLYGIAVRLARRRRRSLARFGRMLGAFALALRGGVERDPESIVSSREDVNAFARALSDLTEAKRVAYVLTELEGLSADEAGRVLDVSPATVRTRLFHARNELRDALNRRGAR